MNKKVPEKCALMVPYLGYSSSLTYPRHLAFPDNDLKLGTGGWQYISEREIKGLRIYNRALTSNEVANNFVVDTKNYILDQPIDYELENTSNKNLDEIYEVEYKYLTPNQCQVKGQYDLWDGTQAYLILITYQNFIL